MNSVSCERYRSQVPFRNRMSSRVPHNQAKDVNDDFIDDQLNRSGSRARHRASSVPPGDWNGQSMGIDLFVAFLELVNDEGSLSAERTNRHV